MRDKTNELVLKGENSRFFYCLLSVRSNGVNSNILFEEGARTEETKQTSGQEREQQKKSKFLSIYLLANKLLTYFLLKC